MSIQLEDGKSYFNRLGVSKKVKYGRALSRFSFTDEDDRSYTAKGSYSGLFPCEFDLVSEDTTEEDNIKLQNKLNEDEEECAFQFADESQSVPTYHRDEAVWEEYEKTAEENTASKFDNGKNQFGLIPPLAEAELAWVFTYGASKYGAWNYLKGHESLQLYNATRRHMHSYLNGQFYDDESGLPHLAHAAASIMMLLEQHLRGTVKDNRPPTYEENKAW